MLIYIEPTLWSQMESTSYCENWLLKQRWNWVDSTVVDTYNVNEFITTIFNVEKTTSLQRSKKFNKKPQISFSTKYQRWKYVDELWRSILFQSCHFVKSVCIRSYSGPYFSTFWLNTVRKLRITLNTNTFYGVWSSVDVFSGMEFCTFSFLSLGQDVFSYLSMRRFFFFFSFFYEWWRIYQLPIVTLKDLWPV